jgi:hypothetical protein
MFYSTYNLSAIYEVQILLFQGILLETNIKLKTVTLILGSKISSFIPHDSKDNSTLDFVPFAFNDKETLS